MSYDEAIRRNQGQGVSPPYPIVICVLAYHLQFTVRQT